MSQLRRIDPTPENLKRVAEVLYESFKDDPAIRASVEPIADEAQQDKFRREQWFPRLVKASALSSAEFYTVGDDWKGVSIWLPPGKTPVGTMTAIRAGLPVVFWHLGIKGVRRILFGGMQEAEKAQRDLAGIKNHMCWYCFFVAVLPQYQGQGLSKLLMSPHTPVSGLQLAPTHDPQYPSWLESTTQKSRAVYLKLGFTDVKTVSFAPGETDELGYTKKDGPGVPMYCMVLPKQS